MKDCEAAAAISSDGVVIFAEGMTCCAACAPRGLDRHEIERAAEQQARHYSRNSGCAWTVFEQPSPRPCPHDAGRQHWLLVC